MNELAIIIPAYKIDFFEDVLISLSRQTCKDFNVYVGIDASKDDFEKVVEKYKSGLNLFCVRFEDNLGGMDLVGQWERCIGLTHGESWLWMFSDDDVLGERCVELFLKEADNRFDLYHFNVKRINGQNKVICEKKHFLSVMSGKEMFLAKQRDKIDSFVVEYIFSRKIYEAKGGFQRFPMAWGSDIATWIKFAGDKGIKTIDGDFVYWRKSSENITPNKTRPMAIRKITIETNYYAWVNGYYQNDITWQCAYLFVRSLTFYSPWLSWQDASKAISHAKEKHLFSCVFEYMLKCGFPLIALAKRIKSSFQNQDRH